MSGSHEEFTELARQVFPRFVCTDNGVHKARRLRIEPEQRRPNPFRSTQADEYEGWQVIVRMPDGNEVDAVTMTSPSPPESLTRDRRRVSCPKCGRVYVLTRDPIEILTEAMRAGVSRIDLSVVL